jgi:hypothetical protein
MEIHIDIHMVFHMVFHIVFHMGIHMQYFALFELHVFYQFAVRPQSNLPLLNN